MVYNKNWWLSAVIGCLICVSGSALSSDENNLASVSNMLHNETRYSLFTRALDISHVWEKLGKLDKAVILVPDNEAMEREGSAFLLHSVYMTDENVERLQSLIGFHVIPGVSLSELYEKSEEAVKTLSGECLFVSSKEGRLLLGPEKKMGVSILDARFSVVRADTLLIQDYRSDNCN